MHVLSGLFADCAILFFFLFMLVLNLAYLTCPHTALLPYVMSACMQLMLFYVSLYVFIFGQKLFRAYVKMLFQCRISIEDA